MAGGVLKVANYLIRNDSTRLWVEVALALLFELDKDWTPKEWQEFVEQPSFAYVEFCMEPSDIHTMQRLLADPGGFTHTNVEGMLQVLHLVKPDQCDPPQTPNAGQMAYWTTGREDAIRKGMPNVPVISVVIGNRLIEGLTATMAVYPKTVNIARKKEPFYSFSPLNGRMTKYEFNLKNIFMWAPLFHFPTCILHSNFYVRLINMHIRADKENSMRLRQPLRECDGLLLKDAVQNLPGHAEDTIRRKLAYEEIYQPNARYDLSIPYPLILVKKDTEPQHYSSVIPDPLAIQRRIPNPATTSDQEQC